MTAPVIITTLAVVAALIALALFRLRVTRPRADQRKIAEAEHALGIRPGTVTLEDVGRMLLQAYDGPGLMEFDESYITVTKRAGLVTKIGRAYPTLEAAVDATFPGLKERLR